MGGIKSCVVHDLLYDLCLEKCKEDNFFKWAESGRLVVDDIRCINHHRLCIGESDPFFKACTVVTKRELPTSPLHSFLWLTKSYEVRRSSLCLLESFKTLTVLKLKLKMKGKNKHDFPEVILSCICLRYLALKFKKVIREVPPAIVNLWKLGTLIVEGSEFTWLPVCMWNMESLRHVDVRAAYLDFEGFNQKQSNIETLGRLYLEEDDSATAEFLRRFPNLRKLSCDVTKRTGHILKFFSLLGPLLTRLQYLDVSMRRWNGNTYRYEANINPTYCNLPKIENLNKLTLSQTELPWSVLSEIGKQLPNLCVLKLDFESCKGASWKLEEGEFSKLIYLKLYLVEDIEEFDVSGCDENPPFPNLEHLVLQHCVKLREIPSVFGEINTLKAIMVDFCPVVLENSAMTILEEQREFGNHSLQVIVNGRSRRLVGMHRVLNQW